MSTRRHFLLEFFRKLKTKDIAYVVTRNYDDALDSTTSDVDLLTRPNLIPRIISCLEETAAAQGFSIVQCIEFTCRSLCLWNGDDFFLRIDIDTSVRWRPIALMNADEVLERRRFECEGEIAVPSWEDEMMILISKILWMEGLSERYENQMQRLLGAIDDRTLLKSLCTRIFGINADLLATSEGRRALKGTLRSALFRALIRSPKRLWQTTVNGIADLRRLLRRRAKPPGVLLQIYSEDAVECQSILDAHTILFPASKSKVFDGASGKDGDRRLFRGGLVIERYPSSSSESALKAAKNAMGRWSSKENRFALVCLKQHPAYLLHPRTGSMQTLAEKPSGMLGGAIARALAKELSPSSARGVFTVLIGLDGAGKTTLARRLAESVLTDDRFTGIRYLHWIPRPSSKLEFPLPALAETPRKEILSRTPLNAFLSALRLASSVIRANLGYSLYCAPALRRGHLLVLDRYFLNYWLDPDSVRYVGPTWLLKIANRLFPKPDGVLILNADEATLLSRKRELTPDQIREQRERLARLPSEFRLCLLDAALSPDLLSKQALEQIKAI